MEKKLNLVQILENCPEGTKLYSTIFGNVKLYYVDSNLAYPINVITEDEEHKRSFMSDGRYCGYNGECTLFPSKDQRDWSKFVAPKLPEGTWVVCYRLGTLLIRRYDDYARKAFDCIIPFDKFDPNNLHECMKKHNYAEIK